MKVLTLLVDGGGNPVAIVNAEKSADVVIYETVPYRIWDIRKCAPRRVMRESSFDDSPELVTRKEFAEYGL